MLLGYGQVRRPEVNRPHALPKTRCRFFPFGVGVDFVERASSGIHPNPCVKCNDKGRLGDPLRVFELYPHGRTGGEGLDITCSDAVPLIQNQNPDGE